VKVVFFVNITKSNTHSPGYQVRLRFQLTQHCRDEQLMKSLVEYFDCGNLYFGNTKEAVDYCVEKYSDLTEKIIPLFDKHLILGVKYQDFEDFVE